MMNLFKHCIAWDAPYADEFLFILIGIDGEPFASQMLTRHVASALNAELADANSTRYWVESNVA
jgi:hypothetical protein